MFEDKIIKFADMPTRQKDRKCTDVICTIIGSVFALTMFILAFVWMNQENYFRTNFPTDSDSVPCGYATNAEFSFVYFPDIHDITTRVCVSSCPRAADFELECKTNGKVPSCLSINIYETESEVNRLGGFCYPTNQVAKQQLIHTANLQEKVTFLEGQDVMYWGVLFASLLGFLWLIVVQAAPRFAPYLAIVLAVVVLVGAAIFWLVTEIQGMDIGVWRIVLSVLMVVLGLAFALMMLAYHRHIKMIGILLEYSCEFLGQKPLNFLNIFVFLLFTFTFLILCLFQYLAFTSHSTPTSSADDIYLHLQASTALTILTIIQFIWGIQFLKDSFNFIVSGNSTQWYCQQSQTHNCCIPVSRLLKFNFGSVVGGSFLNGFFNFINFVLEMVRCYPDGNCAVCAPVSKCFTNYFCCFFDLVRNDTYAYINLTGIPYCDSARNCESLCNHSSIFVGRQSVMFLYRLCSHVFCIGTTIFFVSLLMLKETGSINLSIVALMILFTYCLVTYFIDVHADAAEGIQVSYLLERYLDGGKNLRDIYFQGLRNQLEEMETNKQNGKC